MDMPWISSLRFVDPSKTVMSNVKRETTVPNNAPTFYEAD
jgi:hypothetical protein